MADLAATKRLIGMGLYSDDLAEITTELEHSIELCQAEQNLPVPEQDLDLLRACIEVVGHIARRFEAVDPKIVETFLKQAELESRHGCLQDDLVAMFDDIINFIPGTKSMRPKSYREFKR